MVFSWAFFKWTPRLWGAYSSCKYYIPRRLQPLSNAQPYAVMYNKIVFGLLEERFSKEKRLYLLAQQQQVVKAQIERNSDGSHLSGTRFLVIGFSCLLWIQFYHNIWMDSIGGDWVSLRADVRRDGLSLSFSDFAFILHNIEGFEVCLLPKFFSLTKNSHL
jgi:hypothetical protein